MPTTAPAHWDGRWQHRPLLRARNDEPRRPLTPQPDGLPERANESARRLSELYWREWCEPVTWADLRATVTEGFPLTRRVRPADVALFPAASGLVILDCDVKTYHPDTGFVVTGNTATLTPPVTRYGLDDLRREVENLGHDVGELATYAVRTRSGGVHLYYRENPRYELRTTGHRHDWRVDVIAHNGGSDRSWVAAPPTPGYAVVRDLPVADLPDWLASWLAGGLRALPRLGGDRRRTISGELRAARQGYVLAGHPADRNDLYRAWINHELQLVALANQHGGWNDAINRCAWTLFRDAGLSYDQVEALILKAAAPTDERERRNATTTIRSAWNASERGDRFWRNNA